MDFLKELGPLALASRLRRLTERLTQDVAHLYRALEIDFEPRWFPVFYLLSRKAPLGVVDIARILGVSHPAVNQIAGEMIAHGLVEGAKDQLDKRKRMLKLTEAGHALVPALSEIWDGLHQAVQDALDEGDAHLLKDIEHLETALDRQSLQERFMASLNATAPSGVAVISYDPAYREAFKQLNLAWIQQHFEVEPEDETVLNDPETYILKPGGQVLFAQDQATQEILGTCALLLQPDGSYELAKMTVAEQARGRRIGKHLLEACITFARQQSAPHLSLETNSTLTAAVHLYTKLGFILQPADSGHPSPFKRTDMRMRLSL